MLITLLASSFTHRQSTSDVGWGGWGGVNNVVGLFIHIPQIYVWGGVGGWMGEVLITLLAHSCTVNLRLGCGGGVGGGC